ncbi:MAG: hypothetical protein JSW55_18395 [Chloroflexota bacterium]|nr:MAG: hypothetical protein JSW55_18395 [Chloroflexota bacterium]
MKRSSILVWAIGSLLLAVLACAQAGEIIAPEEATRRAEEEQSDVFTTGNGGAIEDAELQPGDQGELVGSNFIINFFERPGGRIIAGQERGAIVTVLEAADDGERIWYKIEAPTGEGWVTENSIEKVAGDSAEEDGSGGEISGPQPGDTVYLTGTGFIINLLKEPNGLINAGQNRGAEVVIQEVFEQDGEVWYLVDAEGGDGWIPAENISTEAP